MEKNKVTKKEGNFTLVRENYILIAIGFIIIIIGFFLMVGGRTNNPTDFSDKIFSFRRITLAPIVVLLGFAIEIWAIMRKPRKEPPSGQ